MDMPGHGVKQRRGSRDPQLRVQRHQVMVMMLSFGLLVVAGVGGRLLGLGHERQGVGVRRLVVDVVVVVVVGGRREGGVLIEKVEALLPGVGRVGAQEHDCEEVWVGCFQCEAERLEGLASFPGECVKQSLDSVPHKKKKSSRQN